LGVERGKREWRGGKHTYRVDRSKLQEPSKKAYKNVNHKQTVKIQILKKI
jgi:hypothetical protein